MIELDDKARKLIEKDPEAFRDTLAVAHERLKTVTEAHWQEDRLEQVLRGLAYERGVKLGAVFQPVRVAVTGNAVSEPVDVLLVVVGMKRGGVAHWSEHRKGTERVAGPCRSERQCSALGRMACKRRETDCEGGREPWGGWPTAVRGGRALQSRSPPPC